MKIFFSYIKYRIKGIAVFIMSLIVFAVVFTLYSLDLEPLTYSLAISVVFSIPIVISDFHSFKKRHAELLMLYNGILNDIDLLPEPKNLPAADYDALVRLMFAEKCKAQSEKSLAITELSDYYTLWAHQIKTPIAAMRLILQTLPENDEMKDIDEQLFKIEEYVEMVLTYVRSDEKTGDYIIRLAPLDPIIKSAVKKYRKSFIRKKITLEYEDVGISAVTDEKWLLFVIGQLLSNSLKYTPQGGTITIFSPAVNTLVIKDTGIGVSPEDLPRICEKGYTGYNGRADKKSTGIGLYLSNRVMTRLSHKLEISSEVGVGTAVTIRFPDAGRMYE